MSEGSDPDSGAVKYLGLPKRTVVLEVVRASYAVGLAGVMMISFVFGIHFFCGEDPDVAGLTLLSVGVLVPVVLYFYDRRHERDLVIAEIAHAIVRPFAVLYRIFVSP